MDSCLGWAVSPLVPEPRSTPAQTRPYNQTTKRSSADSLFHRTLPTRRRACPAQWLPARLSTPRCTAGYPSDPLLAPFRTHQPTDCRLGRGVAPAAAHGVGPRHQPHGAAQDAAAGCVGWRGVGLEVVDASWRGVVRESRCDGRIKLGAGSVSLREAAADVASEIGCRCYTSPVRPAPADLPFPALLLPPLRPRQVPVQVRGGRQLDLLHGPPHRPGRQQHQQRAGCERGTAMGSNELFRVSGRYVHTVEVLYEGWGKGREWLHAPRQLALCWNDSRFSYLMSLFSATLSLSLLGTVARRRHPACPNPIRPWPPVLDSSLPDHPLTPPCCPHCALCVKTLTPDLPPPRCSAARCPTTSCWPSSAYCGRGATSRRWASLCNVGTQGWAPRRHMLSGLRQRSADASMVRGFAVASPRA